MSKFYLIRHSITKGNLEKRYIGAKTDEPLCKAGYELLKEKHYPKVEKVIASPMKRCIETAQLLFPDTQIQIEESLRECDFGEFENKNYQELSQSKAYQAWITVRRKVNHIFISIDISPMCMITHFLFSILLQYMYAQSLFYRSLSIKHS
jgi:broad specificity phosphatase PhoE